MNITVRWAVCIVFLTTTFISQNINAQDHDHEDSEDCLPAGLGIIFEAAPIEGAKDFHPGHLHAGVFFAGTSQKVILTYFRSGNTLGKATKSAHVLNEVFGLGHPPNIEIFPPNRHPPFSRTWEHLIKKYSYKHSSKWSIWIVEYDKDGDLIHPHEIFLVDGGELSGYINRAPGGRYYNRVGSAAPKNIKNSHQITSELVANWWKAYLEDILSMVMCSQHPEHTEGTFAGSIYEKLYERAREHHPSGLIELDEWKKIFGELSFNDRTAMSKPGQFIPANFSGEHDEHDDD